ncbi:MAG: hypothetical protein MI867_09410 [Pseudomonadales bacterium]|nr:hypothetical protein [Pseudomonadales bacterium]
MKKLILPILLTMFAASGCTTMVANDYPVYLTKNQGNVSVPSMKKVASYTITNQTMNHSFKVKSFMAGAANAWIVEVGEMLDMTLKTPDYSPAFSQNSKSLRVKFDLESYEFKNFQTYLSLNVKVTDGGKELLSKTYSTIGKNQSGKVVMGGAFAMKNAVQQSTKFAIDDILSQLLNDMKNKNIAIVKFIPSFS